MMVKLVLLRSLHIASPPQHKKTNKQTNKKTQRQSQGLSLKNTPGLPLVINEYWGKSETQELLSTLSNSFL